VEDHFVKRSVTAPPGFYAVEAAGLRWLAAAGGALVAEPVEVTGDRIVLPRLAQVAPTPELAEEFGRGLAATHRAGAPWFGSAPPGVTGSGFIAELPLPMRTTPPHGASADAPWPPSPADRPPSPAASAPPAASDWGGFYATLRLRPYADGAWSEALDAVCDRLEAGDESLTGPPEPPSRLHGDLWSGNVVWTPEGGVLIDPAAHGGHRETDLAMLALFGLPYLDRVLAAYDEAYPLADGWRERVDLHQLHPLLVHACLFGGSYATHATSVAERYA
jgi:fructosamine-3-kinase